MVPGAQTRSSQQQPGLLGGALPVSPELETRGCVEPLWVLVGLEGVLATSAGENSIQNGQQ